ncbi:DUF4352 domain-containing protein [Bacillus mycoides]|uniref:DUF4352 domain-containing protein n=1 Tax=Bacillus mycoides TaxID=1405 RepID=UPI003D02A0DD
MKRKRMYVVLLLCLLIVFCFYRYYKVNKDVPLKYTLEYSSKGEVVVCDDLEIRVNSANKGDLIKDYKRERIPITVDAQIKNTSNKTSNVLRFIETSLGVGYNKNQTNDGEFDIQKLKKLQPNETVQVKLVYVVDKDIYEKNNEPMYLYIPTELYHNQLMDKAGEGIRYGKAIKL